MMCMCQYSANKPKNKERNTNNDELNNFVEYMNGKLEEPSEDLKKFVDNVLLTKRYLWIWREKKIQYARCSNCNNQFKTDYNIRHNEETICPKCKRSVTARYSGYSRQFLYEQDNIIWYEKSHKDKNVIVAKAFSVVNTHVYEKRKTNYYLRALYKFEIGKCNMSRKGYYDNKLYLIDDIQTPEYGVKFIESVENFYNTIKDTDFRYYDYYLYDKYYKLLQFYSKYPRIDTLSKVGLNQLIKDKMYGRRTYNCIKWNGKNLFEILKINKQDYKTIKENDISITMSFLKLFQEWKKLKLKIDVKYLKDISVIYSGEILDVINFSKNNDIKINKVLNFIEKQFKLVDEENKKLFQWRSSLIRSWEDYLNDCKTLNMDLKDKSVFFPKNLYQAHQNTISQIKIKENSKYDSNIKLRLKSLSKYLFEDDTFLIRPAASSKEMIEEGKNNHNCVGTYVKRYAEGETLIMFVRNKLEADKTLVTVEIRDNKIVQARQDRNKPASEEVMNFLRKFEMSKLGGIKVNG